MHQERARPESGTFWTRVCVQPRPRRTEGVPPRGGGAGGDASEFEWHTRPFRTWDETCL